MHTKLAFASLASLLFAQACSGDAAETQTPPTEIASRQRVTFRFSGAATSWVAVAGSACDPHAFARGAGASWTPLMLTAPFVCECECNPPRVTPVATEWRRIDAASRPSVTWDARALVRYAHPVNCGQRFPGRGVENFDAFVAQPVAAGHYRVAFAIRDDAPSGCNVDGATATCSASPSGSGTGFGSDIALCPSPRTVTVEFDLPATGDIEVPVTVPQG